MANSSKLFYFLAGLLTLLIVGLFAAIFQQRASRDQAEASAQLRVDKERLEAIEANARTIADRLSFLETRNTEATAAWTPLTSRFFSAESLGGFETLMAQVASAARLDVTRIESVTVLEKGAFKERTYHVRLVGPMTGLPAWAEALYRQSQLMTVSRISVVSPDYQFQRIRMKATVTLYEPRPPEEIVSTPLPVERLAVDLSYTQDKDVDDPVYGPLLQEARARAQSVEQLRETLVRAAALERSIAAHQALVEGAQSLQETARNNRRQILEAIPTLYVRVRNSPMGSSALQLQGKDMLYPEVAVDD